jgi:hypothetical protein
VWLLFWSFALGFIMWTPETIGRKPGTFRTNDERTGLAMTTSAMTTSALTKELRLVDVNSGTGSARSLT